MTFKPSHVARPTVVSRLCPSVRAGCGLLMAAAAAALGACSPYQAPTLAIQGIAQTDESPSGVVLQLTLSAGNPNEVSLPLREIRYSLDLDPGEEWAGAASFSGVRSPEATLRAGGTQQIVLPAALALEPDQPRPVGLVPYRLDATLVYITPGAFAETLFDTGVRRPSASFSQSGLIDFGAVGGALIAPPVPPNVDPAAAPAP